MLSETAVAIAAAAIVLSLIVVIAWSLCVAAARQDEAIRRGINGEDDDARA